MAQSLKEIQEKIKLLDALEGHNATQQKQLKDLIALEKEWTTGTKAAVANAEELVAQLKAAAGFAKQNGVAATNALQTQQAELDLKKALLADLFKELDVNDKNYAQKKAALELDRQSLSTDQEKLNNSIKLQEVTKGTITALTGIDDSWKKTFIGSILQSEDAMTDLAGAISETVDINNVFGSTMMKVQEMTMLMVFQTDGALANLNKMTGATGALNDATFEAFDATKQFGVSMDDAAGVAGALHQNMSGFAGLGNETKASMIGAAAQLKAVGISGEAASKGLSDMMTSLGMSSDQAIGTQKDMAAAALAIGMAPSEMADGFNNAMPVLAAYGKQAPAIFKKVAAAAKGLNVSMETLMSMTAEMDTFEGSARAAGKLNAVLGGPLLNSMDLLNATEDERIRMVLQSVEATGKSWQSMGKFERKAVAAAAGITDMNEANKMFSKGVAGFDEYQDKLALGADEQERLEKAQAAGVSMTEKLTALMNDFAMAVMPIVDGLRWMIDGVMTLNQMMGGALVPILIGVVAALWLMHHWTKIVMIQEAVWMAAKKIHAAVMAFSTGAKVAEAIANVGVATTAAPAAAGEVAVGTAAWYAMIPVAALAIGLGMLALGFGLIAVAIAGIIWAFVYLIKLFMEAPVAALYAAGALVVLGIAVAILVGIFNLLAPIAPIAMVSMMMIGYGLMFLAVPMAIFGAGFAMFAAGISMLDGGMAGSMLLIAAALVPFAFALMLAAGPLLIAGILIGPAAILLGLGLTLLGLGVKFLVENADALPGMGWALAEFSLGLLVAAPALYLAALMIGPGVMILGGALFLLGLGIKMLADYSEDMPTIGSAISGFAWNLLGAAFPLYLAGMIIAPGAALLGIGLFLLGMGIKMIGGAVESMDAIAESLAPFAVALLTAAVPLYLAALMLLPTGIMLAIAGVPFFIGAALIAAGMALLNEPLMLFANAVAAIGPFIPMLPALAAGLLTLAFALPIFGLGVLFLGILASLPFFSTGLGVIAKALAIFANAMKEIPTEKAKALGQIFEGMGQLTDLKGTAKGIKMFGYALFPLAWGLAALPSPADFIAMSEGLAVFGEAAKEYLLPVGIGLATVAPLLFVAAPLLWVAGLILSVALPLLSFGLMWLSFGLLAMAPALPFMAALTLAILPFSMMMLVSAPILFMAGLWLLPAALMWYMAALLMAPAMIMLGMAFPVFAIGMLILIPLIPFMIVLGQALFVLGMGFQALGIGIGMLWDKVGGWWSDFYWFCWNLSDGLRHIGYGARYLEDSKGGISATGSLFKILNSLDAELPNQIMMIAYAIRYLAESLQDLPLQKTIALTATLDAFEGAIHAAIKMKAEAPEGDLGARGGAAASGARTASIKTKSNAGGQMVEALKGVFSGGGGGNDVVLVLNNRELGRAIDAHLAKKHKLSLG